MQAALRIPAKLLRWRLRRLSKFLRWGRRLGEAPIVFANAMPKSGSHLIYQVLQGLTDLGPYVNPGYPPVTRSEDNSNLPQDAVLANLQRLRPGDIAYGYLHAKEPFLSTLTRPPFATIFVYRDPRDVIISQVFYASEMHPGHGMHAYYTEQLENVEQRIQAAILGVEEAGHELSPIRAKYEHYLGWLDQEEVLALRFEDLVLETEGTLNRLLDFLAERGYVTPYHRQRAVDGLHRAIRPRQSGTFRKGQPGEWRQHFTEANVAAFKDHTGDLLLRLGYEASSDWSLTQA